MGDQEQLSCCHLTADCSPDLFCELPFLQEQCHPHLRDAVGKYFKSCHGLEISHDFVQIGSLHFFVCSWVLAGTGKEKSRELGKKGEDSTDCCRLTHKFLCVFKVCLTVMCE